MAADKNGKKLPTGIRRKSENSYEVRVKHDGKTYYEYASTITEAKKKRVDLKYKLTHGTYIKPATYTFDEWFNFWIKNEGADIFLDYLSDQSKSMSVLYRTQIS